MRERQSGTPASMSNLQIRVSSAPRARFPDEQTLQSWLTGLLHQTLQEKGALPAAALVVRERTVDLVDLTTVAGAGRPLGVFLAGLAGSSTEDGGAAEAVGLLGRFSWRRGRKAAPVPVALAFVEGPDGRWWHWQCLMSADGAELQKESEIERAAELGDALPDGLGRWWTMYRRRGVRLSLSKAEPPDEIVH